MAPKKRIAIAGLGTVGTAVFNLLSQCYHNPLHKNTAPLEIVAVSARSKNNHKDKILPHVKWFDDPVEMAKQPDIDIVIELIGGAEGAARETVITALKNGCHVVTANKALLAHDFNQLTKLAHKHNCFLKFEAAVAGGIPIIKVVNECLLANNISSIIGIFNGTCNYILSRMLAEKESFDSCLGEAQALGYAEADAHFDVDGLDTAHKLALLSSFAFNSEVSLKTVYTQGIRDVSLEDIQAAEAFGYKIKLLGIARLTCAGVEQRAQPCLINEDSSLARVDGVSNAIVLHTDLLSELFLSGPGAGGLATASAVIADVIDIQRGINTHKAFSPHPSTAPLQNLPPQMHEEFSSYFVRLRVQDKSGAFASIAQHMAENEISLKAILQGARSNEDNSKNIIFLTHKTKQKSLTRAINAISHESYLIERSQMLPVIELAPVT